MMAESSVALAVMWAKATDDGRIVMTYVSPVPDPLRRITFFPADADGWDWTLEMSTDGGENWQVVYKIRASLGNQDSPAS